MIEENKGRRCHVFVCAAVGCGHRIRRYLDTNDKGSTSNLRSHAQKCWGSEAFEEAYKTKDIKKVREVVEKFKSAPDGNLVSMFAKLGAKGVVSYSHRQHTEYETRKEIVMWVAESMRPFSIVEDRGFHVLMKTGRPSYRILTATTVARDVSEVFKKTKARIANMLQTYDGTLSFATDGWTSPNNKAFIAITVHFLKDNAPFSMLLDVVELP
ncbi:hypothetical protein H0H92_016061, partial [Tricholoma furcatifolium]